jgi:hypothetical protein
MGNSPTDISDEFKKSGMTLISQPASDRWLNRLKSKDNKEEGRKINSKD